MHLRVGHPHSQFWPILARFLDYYSLFCGPGAISIVVETQGALMCRSSTLIVFADSGLFRGLLIIVLGSRSNFQGSEPRGAFTCRSWALTVWPILPKFLDYYSPFWGPDAISIVVEP